MEEFKILSYEEENNLSTDERKKYLNEFKNYVINRQLTNVTIGATTIAQRLRKYNRFCRNVVTKIFTCREFEHISTGLENIPKDTGAIFANTHEGVLDTFLWLRDIDHKCVVLHSSRVSKLFLLPQYSVGLVLVDKKDKKSMANSKLDMINLLYKGFFIFYYPESAWLLSPNKMHLPMRYGLIDSAKKTGCPIIPTINVYTYDTTGKRAKIVKVETHYCKPFYVGLNDNVADKLSEFEEILATEKWRILENKGVYNRSSISNDEYIKMLKFNKFLLKISGVKIENEREGIYGSKDEKYVFQHINDVPYNENGELLEPAEVIRLKKINKEHNLE